MNRVSTPSWQEWLAKLKKTFPVIFAASIATLSHSYPNFILLSWADSLDTYSYVIIANIRNSLGSVIDSNSDAAFVEIRDKEDKEKKKYKVFIVGIDPEAYEGQYLERSPLDRAALKKDLDAIYKASPKLVAIDIDISPALGGALLPEGKLNTNEAASIPECKLEGAHQPASPSAKPLVEYYIQSECELYNTILASGIDTVLITPLTEGLQDTAEKANQEAWIKRMRGNSHIYFASPDLPIKNGITLSYTPKHPSKACRAHVDDERDSQNSCPTLGLAVYCRLADSSNCESAQSASKDNQRIDFKPYRNAFGDGKAILNVSNPTGIIMADNGEKSDGTIVFFGAGYGSDDKMLTPVGELYGVNVHAAGFLSQANPVSKLDVHFPKLLSWILDFLVGIPAALTIGYFWRRYFNASTQTKDPLDRQAAYRWIVLIAIALTCYVILVHLLSILLLSVKLHNGSLWLSPLLITVSLLIHTVLFGSIKAATHVLDDHRVAISQPVDSHTSPAAPGAPSIEQAGQESVPKSQSLRLGMHLLVLIRKATPVCVVLFALWSVIYRKD